MCIALSRRSDTRNANSRILHPLQVRFGFVELVPLERDEPDILAGGEISNLLVSKSEARRRDALACGNPK